MEKYILKDYEKKMTSWIAYDRETIRQDFLETLIEQFEIENKGAPEC